MNIKEFNEAALALFNAKKAESAALDAAGGMYASTTELKAAMAAFMETVIDTSNGNFAKVLTVGYHGQQARVTYQKGSASKAVEDTAKLAELGKKWCMEHGEEIPMTTTTARRASVRVGT